jgi:membrane protease YdiL (CAAX protease family)
MAPKKVVNNSITLGALWLLAMFLFFLSVHTFFEAPMVFFSIIALVVGAVIWSIIGYLGAKKTFKTIEQYGVTGQQGKGGFSLTRALIMTFAMLAVLIGAILLALYIAYYQPYWRFLVNLLVPFPSAFLFTSAVFCWRWQRRSKRTLYMEVNKVYPYPYMDVSTKVIEENDYQQSIS